MFLLFPSSDDVEVIRCYLGRCLGLLVWWKICAFKLQLALSWISSYCLLDSWRQSSSLHNHHFVVVLSSWWGCCCFFCCDGGWFHSVSSFYFLFNAWFIPSASTVYPSTGADSDSVQNVFCFHFSFFLLFLLRVFTSTTNTFLFSYPFTLSCTLSHRTRTKTVWKYSENPFHVSIRFFTHFLCTELDFLYFSGWKGTTLNL